MEKNMHIIDRVIRFLIGINISGYFYFFGIETTCLNFLLIFIAILSFITAVLNFCPTYDLLALKQKSNKKKDL
jgi:hypothetical protein